MARTRAPTGMGLMGNGVGHRAGRVGGGHQHRPPFGQEPGGVPPIAPNPLDRHPGAGKAQVAGAEGLRERRGDAAAAVLEHVGELARRVSVQVGTCRREGSPARRILGEAQAWDSDLTVIARSQRRRRAGDPYVGGETAQVLEFTGQPVLVIPTPDPGRRRHPVRA